MCRYSYRGGECANRHIESLECIGEDNCQHAQANVLTKRGQTGLSGECGLERWLGLYCERHGRFFCPGKDGCASPEMYMKRFEEHRALKTGRTMED